VIYGGGEPPLSIKLRHNELLKRLKAGKFLSTLLNVKVEGADNRVICRAVQRDVVKDLPTHVDFLRLSERSRIALHIPVEFINHGAAPGLKRGGVLTMVRQEVELMVTAGNIPDHVTVDLTGLDINDTIHISDVALPEGVRPTIERNFVVANIQAPSGLRSQDDGQDGEEAEGEAEVD
jgi:large subunit ribosomal protein L25